MSISYFSRIFSKTINISLDSKYYFIAKVAGQIISFPTYERLTQEIDKLLFKANIKDKATLSFLHPKSEDENELRLIHSYFFYNGDLYLNKKNLYDTIAIPKEKISEFFIYSYNPDSELRVTRLSSYLKKISKLEKSVPYNYEVNIEYYEKNEIITSYVKGITKLKKKYRETFNSLQKHLIDIHEIIN